MHIISHRGNLEGPDYENENSPQHVDKALRLGFECEIDVRYDSNKGIFLGHDEAIHFVDMEWIVKRINKLWIHCKNIDALLLFKTFQIYDERINYFWHENDKFTLTSKEFIWAYPAEEVPQEAIHVLPEVFHFQSSFETLELAEGFCTDYPIMVKESLRRRDQF